MKNTRRNCLSIRNHVSYDRLEPKNLLAAVTINGTAGDDVISIQYTGNDMLVNIRLNGELTENVNIEDGLFIDLGDGNDTAKINAMINKPDIDVRNVETLHVHGRNNLWRVHDDTVQSETNELVGGLFGTINNNLRFSGAHQLKGGLGIDSFNIHSFNHGMIYGGDGDDVFRFGRGDIAKYGGQVFGGNGSDYFGLYGEVLPAIDGGGGFDRISLRASDLESAELTFNAGGSQTWSLAGGEIAVEQIIGLSNGQNSVAKSNSGFKHTEFRWVMDGEFTRAIHVETGQTLQMIDFYSFDLSFSAVSADQFYVRSTAANVNIAGGGLIQVSSTIDPTLGDLDGIRHDINISPGHEIDLVSYADVVISNQAGEGINFVFDANRRITGLPNGGSIGFNALTSPFPTHRSLYSVEVYGSDSGIDRFVFEHSWTETSVFGLGGNDTFMLGGATASLDGSLSNLLAPIHIYGGEGEDRIIANDRGATPGDFDRGVIREYEIRDQTLAAMFGNQNDSDIAGSALISFDDSTEIVRVNASSNYQNHFRIQPHVNNRFVVDSSTQTQFEDRLEIVGVTDPGTILPSDGDDGVWLFDDYEPIFFMGVETLIPVDPAV